MEPWAAPRVLTAGDVVGMLDGDVGAYVHVPFCTRICPFCPYNKVVPAARAARGATSPPWAARSQRVPGRRAPRDPGGFTSLYVGGGTPTLFPDELRRPAGPDPRRRRAGHRGAAHARDRRSAWTRCATWASPPSASGRSPSTTRSCTACAGPTTPRTARAAVVAAVGRFDLVDVDLIVDVELDDRLAGAFLRDLTDCFELGVDQVSTYPLMRFGYTPFGRARHDRRREHEVLADATRIAADARLRAALGVDVQPARARRRTRRSPVGASWAWARAHRRSSARTSWSTTSASRPTSTPSAAGRLPVARWLHLGSLGRHRLRRVLAGLRRADLPRGAGGGQPAPDPRPRGWRWHPWSPRGWCAGSAPGRRPGSR